MAKYNIPIVWQSYQRFEVEADNLQEAVSKALKEFLSIPDDSYLEDSFEIDSIIEDDYPNESFNLNDVIEGL